MVDDPMSIQGLVCPLPLPHKAQIVMGHGSGGTMSNDLIQRVFFSAFDNSILAAGNDAGSCRVNPGTRLAISTDSHVVSPLIFPGGDIGRLAVCGTVNDVSMLGALPLFLSAGFILEEGLDVAILERVVDSMNQAASEAAVQIVAGDTKVVQRGKGDGLYINTTGIGLIRDGLVIGGEHAQPGDTIILSGSIGDHGIAVLAARGELGFETNITSDVAPLNSLVNSMLAVSERIHVLRDPTRGGLATSLNEIARQSQRSIVIDENAIPVRKAVNAACEILGFDPLYVANEGKLVAIIHPDDAERTLQAMRSHPLGKGAVVIGHVEPSPAGRVLMKTRIGSTRIVDMLSGEMLPRIC
ncbi:MAG: hydrogenase expression/formation protein HypE [Chloroflexi bacterium RBG_16_52_11]|nr:MAG: hydrogenase expression/formation protein HypE [Chloroflexi bacterium RBG_16_52_11]